MPRRAERTKGKAVAGKRYPLNMRTTFELRRQLESAAQASGRSLAQEIEHQLDRSFDQTAYDRALMDFFGGDRMFYMIQSLSAAINRAADQVGYSKGEWMDHPEILQIIKAAIDRAVDENMAPNNEFWSLISKLKGPQS